MESVKKMTNTVTSRHVRQQYKTYKLKGSVQYLEEWSCKAQGESQSQQHIFVTICNIDQKKILNRFK